MSSFASRKILLVDDDDELRRVYTSHLMSHGFTVEEATGELSAAAEGIAESVFGRERSDQKAGRSSAQGGQKSEPSLDSRRDWNGKGSPGDLAS